ncbi:hypothetical protein Nepgr_011250 [Nepenthes gracilis]|uniref:S1 motif domain-containing protein n=1 Tax=Nepenthes gracilis TaxID=150966 RepID=A0AAD3SEV6_NEPGR|nr:hypothetical protein Nepgr_011250 [Nepenthes gracilis]
METSQITPSTIRPCLFPSSVTKPRTKICFPPGKPKKITVLASKDNDDNKLNQWDLMELKFGQMLGEDPKLTLAKIKGRKANPDASYLEIEKNFHKNKGKIVEVKEVPFDVPRKGKSANGLNLVRPVPKRGMKVGNDNDVIPASVKKSGESVESKSQSSTKSIVPNVILRKPSMFIENSDETGTSLRMKIKPNLSLKMRTEPVKEKFSGMTLLKKPEPISLNENVDKKQDSSSNVEIKVAHGVEENNLMNSTMPTGVADAKSNIYDECSESQGKQASQSSSKVTMLEKPKPIYNKNAIENNSGHASESSGTSVMENCLGGFSESNDYLSSIHQKIEQSSEVVEQTDTVSSEKENEASNPPALEVVSSDYSAEAALQGKPRRLDQSVKAVTNPSGLHTVSTLPESLGGDGEIESSFSSSPLMELEDTDWARAEMLVKSGDRKEVEIISCSTRGFVVSFGSLIGFLPYRNLAAKWKFLAFESWLRKKGLDPSKYRQKLGIIGSYEVPYKNASHQSQLNPENSQSTVVEVTADMEVEDLFGIYEQEKIRFLLSFVGQRIKVNILLADKKSRKLIFSTRQKEKDETVEKKRNLMAKLSIGDVVKCSIKKITFFGIFVEVEGVPALIHQTEISWDVTVNPASFFKIGQIVEAKVHQLDFALDRIFLSLKELTPDPLIGALECIVGDHNALNGTLEASQTDYEWADVDSLIKELQEIEGVHNVSKGRFFLSPGLAPTFQVYMASTFENQYKLLARSGNKVQEVMVQASLDKEEMKSAIITCTNRVQ